MSDRLWLGPTAEASADVNLATQPSMLAAILALQRMPGPHKVSGSADRIAECQRVWRAAYDNPDCTVWIHCDSVSFRAVSYRAGVIYERGEGA